MPPLKDIHVETQFINSFQKDVARHFYLKLYFEKIVALQKRSIQYSKLFE